MSHNPVRSRPNRRNGTSGTSSGSKDSKGSSFVGSNMSATDRSNTLASLNMQLNRARNQLAIQTGRPNQGKDYNGSSVASDPTDLTRRQRNAGVAITSDAMKPTEQINLAPPTPVTTPVTDIGANNTGLTSTEFGTTSTGNGMLSVNAPEDPYKGAKDIFSEYMKQSEAAAQNMPSGADIQRKLEKETQFRQKQQEVNNYSAQLNTIVANRDANVLRVEGQGRGIPEAIIGGQQAQINKEAAIQALPVQAQLAAAQGNLELAQDHINTWGKILMTDATNRYNAKRELLSSVKDFAIGIEFKKIEDLEKKNERTYQETQAFNKARTAALSNALAQGAPSAVVSAIKSATTADEVASAAGIYNGDVLGRQIQQANLANIYSEIDARNKATSVTLNGKPQTEGQLKVQGYADRLNQANGVIATVGDAFTNWYNYGSILPNAAQTAKRQMYDQARLNFVNAKLRQESGAVIGDSEFKKADLQYFPQPGDTSEVLKQKADNRALVISSGYREANVEAPQSVSGAAVTNGETHEYNGVTYVVKDGQWVPK